MSSGLHIHTKKRRGLIGMGFVALLAIVMVSGSVWYGYRWYVRGDVPPVPLLASAIEADPAADITPVSDTQVDAHTVSSTEPRYVNIPTIGVERSRIFSVNTTVTKDLKLPGSIHDTGWYRESTTPGEGYGVVVLNGRKLDRSTIGTYAYAKDLSAGSEISIERGDGKIIIYKVAENRSYTLKQLQTSAAKDMMQPYDTTKEGLNIVVYAGNWIPRDKTYDARILVRAVRVE